MISLLGIPYDASSSFLRGPAKAPDLIRLAIQSPSANLSIENGMSFEVGSNVIDLGDVDFSGLELGSQPGVPPSEEAGNEARSSITHAVSSGLESGRPLLSLGGDHSISFPILQAVAPRFERLTIVQFDAHADLYEDFEGDLFSHACPFARILEMFEHVSLVQVGIRTMNEHCIQQAERYGVRVFEMNSLPKNDDLLFQDPIYISLDLDVLDPAFAPGISHHEPGGMTTRELIKTISDIKGKVIGADLVEYNPTRDQNGVTAMVAAKLAKELAGKLMESV